MYKDDFKNCVAGCKHFSGGEVKHHSSCPNYPESFSEMYDKLRIHNVRQQSEQLIDFIKWLKKEKYLLTGHMNKTILKAYLKSINCA